MVYRWDPSRDDDGKNGREEGWELEERRSSFGSFKKDQRAVPLLDPPALGNKPVLVSWYHRVGLGWTSRFEIPLPTVLGWHAVDIHPQIGVLQSEITL